MDVRAIKNKYNIKFTRRNITEFSSDFYFIICPVEDLHDHFNNNNSLKPSKRV